MSVQHTHHTEDFLRRAAEAKTRIREISPAEAWSRSHAGAVLLDVREPTEYAKDHLEGALNLDYRALAAEIAQVVPDKTKPVTVYCAGGNRGAIAADTLQQLGYLDVASIANGLKGCARQPA